MRSVLVVDDHPLVRDGLKNVLREQVATTDIGEAATAADASRLARERDWDLAIVDISLAGRSGLDVVVELKALRPRMPVLVLSMHSEEQYARRAFRAGAAGYITKSTSRVELAQAIRRVAAGGRYVSPELAEQLATALDRGTEGAPHTALSNREFEVMRLLGSGRTVTEIATILGISDKTVSTYRARILEKMRLRTNADLIRYLIENNLLD
jgi:two-component system, NarL family, invasion response regulator UvrY